MRVDELGVDRARRRLDGRRRQSRDESECHVSGQDERGQGDDRDRDGADRGRDGEHAPHPPQPHPSARHGSRDGLADGGRGQDEPCRTVRARDVLDVQEDREARHPVGEACRQLRRDDADDAGRAGEVAISGHPSTVSRRGRGMRWERVARHAATRRRARRGRIGVSEAVISVVPVDSAGRGMRMPRNSGFFQVPREVRACG